MDSALASGGSILESAGIGSIGHDRSLQQLLTEVIPAAPSLSTPGHSVVLVQYNPIHQTMERKVFAVALLARQDRIVFGWELCLK